MLRDWRSEVIGVVRLGLKLVRDSAVLHKKSKSFHHWWARRETLSHYIKVRVIMYGYYMGNLKDEQSK